MRTRAFGWVLFGTLLSLPLGLAVGCGQSDGDDVGAAGSATAGSSPSGAGTAGNVSGSATGGSATGGNASGGNASGGSASGGSSRGGSSSGGSPAGGSSSGGVTTGGRPDPQAGAGNEAGAGAGLVDCDPLKITCKRAAPLCDPGEVPSVDDVGNCYGECVKIERCACSTAQQCPDPDQYTCWAKQHCGPFVR